MLKTFLFKSIPFITYFATLFFPLPNSIGREIRQGVGWGVIVALIILVWGFSLPDDQDWFVQTSIFGLFGIGLAALWSTPLSESQVVGGMLYFSDASRYYADALRLLSGYPLSNFSARHPLPTLLLAMILWISGSDLKISLMVITAVAAWSAWLASREVRLRWGGIPAGVFCILLFLFYRRFSGLPDSENLGFILGCLAFSILSRTAYLSNSRIFFVGIFFLSLGLTARPGTFIVLPTILMWRWFIDIRSRTARFYNLLLGLTCMGAAFLLSFTVNVSTGYQQGMLFSNYSYTFYGITQGGKGWEQFQKDHPEYLHATEIVAEKAAMDEGLKTLFSHPILTLRGILQAYRDFFSFKPISIFGFLMSVHFAESIRSIDSFQMAFMIFLQLFIAGFTLYGLIYIWRYRADQEYRFYLWVIVGIMASISFLPPIDAGMMRVYIATIPFIFFLPIVGLHVFIKPQCSAGSLENEMRVPFAIILGGALTSFLLVGMVALTVIKPSTIQSPTCNPADSVSAVLNINRGSYLRLMGDEKLTKSNAPNLVYSDFRSSYSSFPKTELIEPLNSIVPNSILMNSINLVNGQQLWVILPLASEKWNGHVISACGNWNPAFLKIGLGFLDVEYILPNEIR